MIIKHKSCVICNEKRGIQKCHIISRKLEWLLGLVTDNRRSIEENLIYLCPNHHFYFDKGLLLKEELDIILKIVTDRLRYFLGIIVILKKKDNNFIDNDLMNTVDYYLYKNRTIKDILIKN